MSCEDCFLARRCTGPCADMMAATERLLPIFDRDPGDESTYDETLEQDAQTYLATPFFDKDGNEGTLDEVYA